MQENNVPLKRNWILAALMLTMMLAAMDITIVSTAIPQIVSDLGGFTEISWVFSIYLLAQTVTIPVYGKLADLYGRKIILLSGICIFLAGSAACAYAWDINSLIGFRGLQGLGAGSIMATVNTIAGDIYTVKERAKIQGWLSSIWGVSAIIGPALGGALTEYVDWRWIFLINIPIGIIALFLIIYFFKEKVTAASRSIDFKGALLILLTLGLAIVYLLESGQAWPWFSWQSAGILVLIISLAIFSYWVEKRQQTPILPVWLWNKRVFAFTNFSMIGMGIIMMGPEIYLPLFTQASLGLGIIASGFVLASMSIGWPTASALSGRLYLRIGFRDTALIGTVLITIACAGFLLIPWPQPIFLIVADQILLGAGFGLLSTPTLVGVQSIVPWGQRGVVTAANVFSRNLGQSIGAAIAGAIFNLAFVTRIQDAHAGTDLSQGNIIARLQNPSLPDALRTLLQQAISFATHWVYGGLVLFSLLTFLAIWALPRVFKAERSEL